MIYNWLGIDLQGKKISGRSYAQNYAQLQKTLTQNKIYLLRADIDIRTYLALHFSLNNKHIILFITQLTILINANVPLLQAFTIIAQETSYQHLHNLILNCKHSIAAGKSLAETLQQYPQYFSSLIYNMINVGEQSGTLDIILNELVQYLQNNTQHKRKIIQALSYPVILLSLALITSGILLTVVIPQFALIYDSFGAPLPRFTQYILALSTWLQQHWSWLGLGCVGIITSIKIGNIYSSTLRYFFKQLPYTLCILKKIYLCNTYYRLSQILGLTLKAGIPLLQAINITSTILPLERHQNALNNIALLITNGKTLYEALSIQQLFPAKMLQLVALGEETGNLDTMFNKIAAIYQEELNCRLHSIHTLLEPIIIIILSIIVGGLVVGMYLPMLQLGTVI